MRLVFIESNRPVTDSLTVAETFGKEHRRVLQDIRELDCSEDFRMHHFVHTPYVHPQNGQSYEKCLMTEQGFAFLAFGYTGKEAARFKEMYIAEFGRMREELNKPQQLPQSYKEALIALVGQVEENERITAEKLQLEQRIETDRPKVLFAESLSISQDSILVADLAKLLKQNGIEVGEMRLFRWLRENGYLIKSGSEYNMPTQRSMEMKLFEIRVSTRQGSDGTPRMQRTPKVTGKGQIYFVNKFKSKGESA